MGCSASVSASWLGKAKQYTRRLALALLSMDGLSDVAVFCSFIYHTKYDLLLERRSLPRYLLAIYIYCDTQYKRFFVPVFLSFRS